MLSPIKLLKALSAIVAARATVEEYIAWVDDPSTCAAPGQYKSCMAPMGDHLVDLTNQCISANGNQGCDSQCESASREPGSHR